MCLMLDGLGRSGAEALEVPIPRGFQLAAPGNHLARPGIGIDTGDNDVLVSAAHSFDGLQRAPSPMVPGCPGGGGRALLGVGSEDHRHFGTIAGGAWRRISAREGAASAHQPPVGARSYATDRATGRPPALASHL